MLTREEINMSTFGKNSVSTSKKPQGITLHNDQKGFSEKGDKLKQKSSPREYSITYFSF